MPAWTSQMVCSVMEGSKAGMQSSMFRLRALLKPRPGLQSRKELEFLGEKSILSITIIFLEYNPKEQGAFRISSGSLYLVEEIQNMGASMQATPRQK